MIKTFFRKLVPTGVGLAGAGACLIGMAALAQSSGPAPSGQIVPGSTGSIGPTQGVSPTGAAPPKTLFEGALSSHTRQTLQEAMNSMIAESSGSDNQVTVVAGQGAELDGTNADVVDFDTLPGPVRDALNGDIQRALDESSR